MADDLWWLLHGDSSGELKVDERVAGLGLGAALLTEVLVTARVQMRSDGVLRLAPKARDALMVRSQRSLDANEWAALAPSPDSIACKLADWLFVEPELPVEDWLAFLAPRARPLVARRLIDAGELTKVSGRRGFRRTVTYRPAHLNIAGWPAARLRTAVGRRAGELGRIDMLLLGLCRALGLHRRLLEALPADAVALLFERVDALSPPWPQFFDRLGQVNVNAAARLR